MTQLNQELKTKLFSQIEVAGKERSLLPFSETLIDETIRQLEDINPISQPLSSNNFNLLIGDWQLIYASNGTVITRPIAEMTSFLGAAIEVIKIWQSLAVEDEEIRANNQALIDLPLIGEYQLSAEGVWRSQSDEQTAQVTFNAFTAQATKFLGQSDWSLPELKIPVLDFLRNEAIWITSYLDENTRIGRGATGNLFVFRQE
ncbi:MAG: PAP/fibrillin family protein [Cyanobacteria bacterium P01_G01_bin.19]